MTWINGKWFGSRLKTDRSARGTVQIDPDDSDGMDVSLPQPEATYWGLVLGKDGVLFQATSETCLLVDAAGNVILTAAGHAIECP